MNVSLWMSDNYIELLGAVAGIVYVFLEIRQSIWLWPVGIITSAVYIWVFFEGKLYADMSLQGYYLIISFVGWYWWISGTRVRVPASAKATAGNQGSGKKGEKGALGVTRVKRGVGIVLAIVFMVLLSMMWIILSRLTDSPVPGWDAFITSLSVIATWMLARKIYEHWFLWIVVNASASVLFLTRGLYPTVILYLVYGIMSFAGLKEWKKTIQKD